MKKKALITSILLSITATAIIGYFIGCGTLPHPGAERAGRTESPDESRQRTSEPQTVAADTVQPEAQKDPTESESYEARVQEDGTSRNLLNIEVNAPGNWRQMNADAKSKREDAPGSRITTGPEPGDRPVVYDYDGDRVRGRSSSYGRYEDKKVRRKLRDSAGDASGKSAENMIFQDTHVRTNGSVGGGLGGFGEYRKKESYGWNGTVSPTAPHLQYPRQSAPPSSLKSNGVAWAEIGKKSSSASARRTPVDLINISADEVWVIARSEVQAVPTGEEGPGCGAMLARLPKEDKEIPLPLKHTDVKGQISGYIATVNVTQQFHNPYDQKIEAVYVFPLPQNAAINEFIMTIGKRRIRGIIRERKEAEKIYLEARRQGYVASLLTQERPNIFTQKVANIEPSKQIDVNIKYFNTLAYVDGWYEFVFPMVVGPRFNPPGFTEGVGAVARGKAGISGQKTEVQYLKPHERSGHDISLAVDIDAGVAIEQLACTSHVITNSSATPERRTVKLSSLDSIPNKDFVLRYKVAGKTVKSALVTHRDKRGGFFTLMLYPPENLSYLKRAPMEMIFVLDCSGSMSGKPIAKAKQAITRALRKLQPNDTFQVIRFSNNASQLGPNPVPATPANIRKGLRYVESLRGSGGTMMIEGIKAALDFDHDPRRFRMVSFMTDGYIGNETEILAEVHRRLGESRIFSFGVGSSVNRYLLDRMAKLGKGAVAYVGLDDSAGEVVDKFYERISHPALTDVTIDWGGMQVADMYPQRIPDLFVGRPIIVTGRFKGLSNTAIRITGKVGDMTQDIDIPVNLSDSAAVHPGIACVWARKKIETLGNQATYDSNPDLSGEIRQVALEYGLMSSYTAFIAVDSSRKTEGDHGITVAVPVPVPDGVRYETTVQN